MIKVTVRFFAIARDLARTEQASLTIPADSTANSALETIVTQYPMLKEWKAHLRLAVNYDYAQSERVLRDEDELAVLPPFSGG